LLLIALVWCKAIKKGWLLLAVLFVLGFFARAYVYRIVVEPGLAAENGWVAWYKWIYYPTYSRLDGLLTGVGIAALFQFRPLLKERITKYGNLQLLLSGMVLTAAYFICSNTESFTESVFGFPLISIGYGLLVMGALSPSCFLYRFKSGITEKLATLSYALYLTHKIIVHLTQVWFSKLNIAKESTGMFLICMASCLAGALLMNKIIEKPFLKWREKILALLK